MGACQVAGQFCTPGLQQLHGLVARWRLSGQNLLHDSGYACPSGSGYQRWLRVTPIAGTPSTYRIAVYVERISMGCTPETRDASESCVSGDAIIND